MRQFLHLPGVSVRAVCDVYPPRRQEVNRLVGAEVPFMPRYEDLLSRSDLDAVLIASPLAFHAEHTIAAAKTGIPIYGEKAMAFQPAECQQVVDRLVQSKTLRSRGSRLDCLGYGGRTQMHRLSMAGAGEDDTMPVAPGSGGPGSGGPGSATPGSGNVVGAPGKKDWRAGAG